MNKALKKTLNNNILKTAVILIIAVLLFVSVGSYLMSDLLLNKVNELKIKGISIKAEQAEVQILRNTVLLEQIEVTDSTNNSLVIPKIRLDGLRYLKLIFSKLIEVDKLSLEGSQLKLNLPFEFPKYEPSSDSKMGSYELLLNELDIVHAEINVKQQKGYLRLHNLNLKLEGLRKFAKSDSIQKPFDIAEIELDADDFLYTFKDSLYLFESKKLALSSKDKTIRIEDATITSNYSKYEIGHQTGVETDWYHILFGTLRIDGFEPEVLKKDRALQFAFVNFDQLDAEIFRDKRLPFPDREDTKLPMEIINSLPFPLHIDSVFINTGKVKYEQHTDGKQKAGAIVLSDLHGKLYEISNIEKTIDTPTTMLADARVMGEGLLDVKFEFPNKKYPVENRVVGSLEPMKLAAINPMLRETVRAEIESGEIITLRFNYTYNNDVSQGSLLMEYDKLKLRLLENKADEKKEILTFLANGLALHSSNRRNENNFQAGKVEFERIKKKSFFNYWWKSLLSGIKSVVITVK